MTSNTNAAANPHEERCFDRAAWLTLAIGLLWFVVVLGLMLINFNYPSDGWTNYQVQDNGGYIVGMNVTGKPSPLQKGDLVVAINGEPYREDPLPPVPANPQVGQVVRYTVERSGQTLEVDVTLVRRDALALWRGFVQMWQDQWRDLLTASLSFLVAAFAFFARPRNRAAQYLLLIFSFFCAVQWFGFADWHPYVYVYPLPVTVVNFFFALSWFWYFFPTWTLLVLTLPVIKAPLRRLPRLLPALLYGVPFTLGFIATWFMLTTHDSFWSGLRFGVALVMFAIFSVVLLGSLIHNWLTLRDPVARAQLLWITLGIGVGWAALIAVNIVVDVFFGHTSFDRIWDQISPWLGLLLPICFAIAITRYRLFDIDIIIRRTLIYSTLTVMLALIYIGSIIVIQALLRPLVSADSELATVASTLAIAALFNPLRRRIQAFIDRRFYRRKYDAAQVLAAFAATARDEVDLDRLTNELLAVVEETLQPEHVSLWLKDTRHAEEERI